VELIVQTLVLGILTGGVYALMAVGLSLIFGVVRVANFAHGALFMVSGYAAYLVGGALNLPTPVAVIAGMSAGGVGGYVIAAIFLRPVYGGKIERPAEYTLVVTFALSLALSAAAFAVFGGDYRHMGGFWSSDLSLDGWIRVSGDRLVAFAVACALILVLLWLVYFTDVGRAWRALTQNRTGARLVGINVARLSNLAFAASGAFVGAASALLLPLLFVYSTSGDVALVKSFVVVVIGGLGSITGSLIGGLLLGIVEVFGATYLGSAYTDAYGFILMIAVLLFRPEGLFGQRVRSV